MKLSDQEKKAIGEIHPAIVATASKNGKPNVYAKGSVRLLDEETVVFADVASPRTVANIRENPLTSILCLDVAGHRSCRIWGAAEIVASGKLFEESKQEFAARKMRINTIVKVAVEEIEVSKV